VTYANVAAIILHSVTNIAKKNSSNWYIKLTKLDCGDKSIGVFETKCELLVRVLVFPLLVSHNRINKSHMTAVLRLIFPAKWNIESELPQIMGTICSEWYNTYGSCLPSLRCKNRKQIGREDEKTKANFHINPTLYLLKKN
jgi:hypothetical protein